MPEGRTRSGGTAPDAIERITDGTQTNRASRRFSTAQDRPSFNAVPHETRPAQTRQHICNSSHRHLANKNMKRTFLWAALLLNGTAPALACTGISFTARDGAFVTARTIEWGESPLPSGYVVIPRQHETVSYTPTGANGLSFRAKYGAVGLTIVREEFIARNQRSRTVGRTVLLPPLRQIPGLRFDPERPDALGSPVCRVDTLAILLRRRSQSRHTDRTGRIDRSLRRLDRPLAHRGRDRQAGRAGVHRRRAPLLRQRSRAC